MVRSSVVVHDLDLECIAALEAEAQPPSLTDSDTVLPDAVAFQRFETIRRRQPQILQPTRRIQLQKAHRRAFQNVLRQPT
jgi:hypothetical protein